MKAHIEVIQYDTQALLDAGNTLLDGLYVRRLLSVGTFQSGAVDFKKVVDNQQSKPVKLTENGLNVVFSGFLSPETVQVDDEVLLSPPDPFFTIFDEQERKEVLEATSKILDEMAIIHGVDLGANPQRATFPRTVFARGVSIFPAHIL